ncbi:MAG: glutamine amidotransferase [Candidatus Saccharimonadales bacterium]
MTTQPIVILQLYPKDMNIYGDQGNLLVLQRRLEWYGYKPMTITYNVGDTLPKDVDIIVGGGGQDSGQEKIHADLLKISPQLKKWADADIPMLMVCGLYQLFGNFFKTSNDTTLKGIGILDIETHATNERLIGNTVTRSEDFGDIVGYENHSGQTTLIEARPLAMTLKGAGNNSTDGTEGARYKNVIGTYLHGSILPKNPRLADFLIHTAVTKRYGEFSSDLIDDSFVDLARAVALERPR